MPLLPTPPDPATSEPAQALAWVREHLGDLVSPTLPGQVSARFRGGQPAADTALATYDVTGYAGTRSTVLPVERRGASGLSPYVRWGLLSLREVWDAVEGGPPRDVAKLRDELLWQEYARHLYARLGTGLAQPLRAQQTVPRVAWSGSPWREDMACMAACGDELATDGWLVNQTRMWVASQWAVRAGADWRDGERLLYRQLVDGSAAANRTGWQWTVGTGTGKAYGFSRWQVEKRAPRLCRSCALRTHCPIQDWPDTGAPARVEPDPRLAGDADPLGTAGPAEVERSTAVQSVWLTGESLGDADPALEAHPDLPAVFVFDAPLLSRLQLAPLRLVFLAENLGSLASRRPLEVRRGVIAEEVTGAVAVTHAPVPGWRRHAAALGARVAEVHPYPWLRRPHGGPASSWSAWVRGGGVRRPGGGGGGGAAR